MSTPIPSSSSGQGKSWPAVLVAVICIVAASVVIVYGLCTIGSSLLQATLTR